MSAVISDWEYKSFCECECVYYSLDLETDMVSELLNTNEAKVISQLISAIGEKNLLMNIQLEFKAQLDMIFAEFQLCHAGVYYYVLTIYIRTIRTNVAINRFCQP